MTHQHVITRKTFAVHWDGDINNIPEGFHITYPEAHWSADRQLVYFSYADLRHSGGVLPKAWMGREKLLDRSASKHDLAGFTRNGVDYYRKIYAFAFYSIKSEASAKQDWMPVFVDGSDKELLELWTDYASYSEFPNPVPRCIEFRQKDHSTSRGYVPIYLGPGDWLVHDPFHSYWKSKSSGTILDRYVSLTNEEMQKFIAHPDVISCVEF